MNTSFNPGTTFYDFDIRDPFGSYLGEVIYQGGPGLFKDGDRFPFGPEPAQFYITVKVSTI